MATGRSLHHHPPLTPVAVLLHSRWAAPLVALAFLSLVALAAANHGAALRGIDEPGHPVAPRPAVGMARRHHQDRQRPGRAHRRRRRRHALAAAGVARVPAPRLDPPGRHRSRPALEWTLKELVDRPRPDIDRLVPGNGRRSRAGTSWPPSPSGAFCPGGRARQRAPVGVVVLRGDLRHRDRLGGVQPRLSGRALAHRRRRRASPRRAVPARRRGAARVASPAAIMPGHRRRRRRAPPHGWRHSDLPGEER